MHHHHGPEPGHHHAPRYAVSLNVHCCQNFTIISQINANSASMCNTHSLLAVGVRILTVERGVMQLADVSKTALCVGQSAIAVAIARTEDEQQAKGACRQCDSIFYIQFWMSKC